LETIRLLLRLCPSIPPTDLSYCLCLKPNQSDVRQRPSRIWRLIRVVPISIMLLSIGVLLTMFMVGGVTKIYAWHSLQYPVLMGLVSLILVIIYAVVKRKFDRLMASTLLLAIICLFPLIMLVKPVAYPSTLENTKPSSACLRMSHLKLDGVVTKSRQTITPSPQTNAGHTIFLWHPMPPGVPN
jgi:hypothetical protein